MSKSITTDFSSAALSAYLTPIAKRFGKAVEGMRNFRLFSEDTIYKWNFTNNFAPLLYRKHSVEMQMNCVFCTHLEKSDCHRHCLKCGMGRYEHCSPLLPGLISCESIYPNQSEELRVPWYYAKTCDCFSRLPKENYLRNFNTPFSKSIFNYEVLESLESGLLSGEKPCHVCASANYEIYKKCYGQEDYHAFSPCRRIVGELAAFYSNKEVS